MTANKYWLILEALILLWKNASASIDWEGCEWGSETTNGIVKQSLNRHSSTVRTILDFHYQLKALHWHHFTSCRFTLGMCNIEILALQLL